MSSVLSSRTVVLALSFGLGCTEGGVELPLFDAGPDAGPEVLPGVADYCDRLLAIEHARLVECFGASPERLAREHEQFLAVLPYRCAPVPPTATNLMFNEDEAERCIEATRTASCEKVFTHWLVETIGPVFEGVLEPCKRVFVGTKIAGEACSQTHGPLCADGLICDDRIALYDYGNYAVGGCSNTCIPTSGDRALGESCVGAGFVCAPPLVCGSRSETPVCMRLPEHGEDCSETLRCALPNVCDPNTEQCILPGTEGAECDRIIPLIDRCEGTLLRCGASGTCERTKNVGDACVQGEEYCAWGHCTDAGFCAEERLLGESCDTSLETKRWCAPGGFCRPEEPRVCERQSRLGEPCDSRLQCLQADCVEGRCQAFPKKSCN